MHIVVIAGHYKSTACFFFFPGCPWPNCAQTHFGPHVMQVLGLCKLQCFFFIGEFLQKFNLKNVISINTKGFFMGKIVQIFQFSKKKKKSKSPDFYNKFQYVAKNIEGSWFFSTFISGM